MKSAAQMSMLIREKKKKMMEDPDVVELSGIPEDAQDIYALHQMEITEPMDHNNPIEEQASEHDQEPITESAEMTEEIHHQPEHEGAYETADSSTPEIEDKKLKRMARIRQMMG